MSEFVMCAYLELTLNKIPLPEQWYGCEDDHKMASKGFCAVCGKPNKDYHMRYIEKYPTWLVDHILPEEFEDILANITPREIFGTGKMLLKDNGMRGDCFTDYARLDKWGDSIVKPPTRSQIKHYVGNFQTAYEDVMAAIKQSPAVKRMVVKFGIIRREEY